MILSCPDSTYKASNGQRINNNGIIPKINQTQVIYVYPNPAHSTINFALLQTGNADIDLLNITGQVVRTIVMNNSNLGTIDVTGLPPGLYIYKAVTNNKTQTGKVVIE